MRSMSLTCAFAALATLSLAGRAPAQTPYLVKDIDPGVGAVDEPLLHPQDLTTTDDALYLFAATSGGAGGLVRIDDAGAIRRVAPFAVTSTSSFQMAADGDRVFFTAEGSLWTSDGTTAGTTLVRTFPAPGAVAAVGGIAAANGTAWFSVVDGPVSELWKSDGTAAGTVRLATVVADWLTATANRVFFIERGTDGLWTSDGTAAGTRRLGTLTVTLALHEAAVVGDTLFFSGLQTGTVSDLWRTDGTDAGTVKVKSFAPSALEGLLPRSLTRFGSSLLFAAGAPEGLWKTDGTESGTVEVRADLKVRQIETSGAVAFVHGRDAEAGAEVWKTDGTTAGTVRVTDGCPGPCNFLNFGGAEFASLPGGAVFVRLFGELWATDGTAAGTLSLGNFPPTASLASGVRTPTSFGGVVYFAAYQGTRFELWRTDGTPAGTFRVLGPGAGPSSDPVLLGGAGDHLVLLASRPDLGRELWTTIGTEASTLPIELGAGPESGGVLPLLSLGERYTFGRAALGTELWSTDGTVGGTGFLAPIGFLGSHVVTAANVDVGLFFGGSRYFRTDATTAGTFPIQPPAGAPSGAFPFPSRDSLTAHGGGFAAVMQTGSDLAVWRVDTDDDRASLLVEEPCLRVMGADERLFLECDDLGSATLWVSDGTRAGTRLLVGLPGPVIPGWVASEGRLYFRVVAPTGWQLWTSDGSAAGTHAVTSTEPLPTDFYPHHLTPSNGVLFFSAATPETGRELWRTDGTPPGTFMLRDVDPGPASGIVDGSESRALVAAGGGVVFAASTADRGVELWRSDGTAAGTAPLPEIAPGPASASPTQLSHHRGRVYLVADDGLHGREPWALDLPSAVSVGDLSVIEGDAGTTTASFVVRLDPASATAVTVAYATAAGSASAGSDFVATAGVLTFAPGQTAASVDVPVVGDEADESTESFALQVVPMAGVAAADVRGAAVIVDDDAPRVSVAGASVTEGDAGPTDAVFAVTLTTGDGQPTATAVTVRAEIEYGTAGADDFPPPSTVPSVVFPAGSASGTALPLNVPVLGDTLDEPNETFSLRLDAGNDAAVPASDSITGVILDDDGIAAASPVEISHGSRVLADLAPPVGRTSDVDFYALRHDLHSSYEIVVDAVSGDATPLQVERVVADGGVFQTALPTGTGNSVAMRFFGLGVSTDHIRVRSAACGTTCGPDDVYRLRMYETTLRSPRVNTVGGQATALIVQNTTDAAIAAVAAYWSAGGAMSSVYAFDVPAHGTAVVDVATVLFEFSGSVTIGHNGPYGGLVGKVVSLDPATGFTFESPLTARPR